MLYSVSAVLDYLSLESQVTGPMSACKLTIRDGQDFCQELPREIERIISIGRISDIKTEGERERERGRERGR
jgi:hypothetical protein